MANKPKDAKTPADQQSDDANAKTPAASRKSDFDRMRRPASDEAKFVDVWQIVRKVLSPISSLKLTLVLFLLSIFLVYAGTTAQDTLGLKEVLDGYFRCWKADVKFTHLFPNCYFPNPIADAKPDDMSINIPLINRRLEGFVLPGGFALGVALGINLLAAHLVRFKIQASGNRLYGGIIAIVAGVAVTYAVIKSGTSGDGIQTNPILSWKQLWYLFMAGLAATVIGTTAWLFRLSAQKKLPDWGIPVFGLIPLSLGGMLAYFLFEGEDAQFDPSSMRILWQLMKGAFAGLVLLGGCYALFKRRAGVVLLHSGVALLMFNEYYVYKTNVEANMRMFEGETKNYAFRLDQSELAITRADGASDHVWRVDDGFFTQVTEDNPVEVDADLPFNVKILDFYKNSQIRARKDEEETPATKGAGLAIAAENVDIRASNESLSNYPSSHIEITAKDGTPIGTYMVSLHLGRPQYLTVDGKRYGIELRFHRDYKNYSIYLIDAVREDYVGTTQVKDYSSHIHLVDKSKDYDQKIRIWMNNPLRYQGETFYQADHQFIGGEDWTGLQIVNNNGWMIPYVCCMIVAVGMFGQFGFAVSRFLQRRAADRNKSSPEGIESERTESQIAGELAGESLGAGRLGFFSRMGPQKLALFVPIAVTGIIVFYMAMLAVKSVERDVAETEVNLQAFGRMPVVAGGRPKPFDSLARNSLMVLSKRQTLKDNHGTQLPALVWLLDVITDRMYYEIDPDTADEDDDYEIEMNAGAKSAQSRLEKTLDSWVQGESIDKWHEANQEIMVDDARSVPAPFGLDEDRVMEGNPVELLDYKVHFPGSARTDEQAFTFEVTLHIKDKNGDESHYVQSYGVQKGSGEKYFIGTRPLHLSYRVLKIVNLQVLQMLGLEPRYSRDHKFLYSYSEIEPAISDFEAGVKKAREKRKADENSLDSMERSLIELSDKWGKFMALRFAFNPRPTPKLPAADQMASMQGAMNAIRNYMGGVSETNSRFRTASIPMAIYLDHRDTDPEKMRRWQSYAQASYNARADVELQMLFEAIGLKLSDMRKDGRLGPDRSGRSLDSSTEAFHRIMTAYANGDAEQFNLLVAAQNKSVAEDEWVYQYEPEELVSADALSYESFFNRLSPFYYAAVLYVFTLIMGLVGWLLLPKIMNRAAFWSILAIFILHTFAMVSRIYISGRPPVTNLYSSALFIGWGGVALGLIFELIFKIGIGNIIASICGAATLTIAHLLHSISDSGDTVSVMQAVLDTQFWLATHVTCITLGYTTTFVAGILGILYVLAGVCSPSLTPHMDKELDRMMYGSLCFAIMFSFIGTVLGGLWADDSWGRFWGWDPKENGALLIVLWNVFVLHCRWDRIVSARGTAVLAIVGNICTSFSWFAVNQLGKGLHAYGFQDGMMATLGWVWLGHVAIIGVGCIPKYAWWSSRHQRDLDAGLVS